MCTRIWVRSAGKGVVCDVADPEFTGPGSAGYIVDEGTWKSFLDHGPRAGKNHLVVSKGATNDRAKLISAAKLEGYSFGEACKRLDVELGPRIPLDTDEVHRLHHRPSTPHPVFAGSRSS